MTEMKAEVLNASAAKSRLGLDEFEREDCVGEGQEQVIEMDRQVVEYALV